MAANTLLKCLISSGSGVVLDQNLVVREPSYGARTLISTSLIQ